VLNKLLIFNVYKLQFIIFGLFTVQYWTVQFYYYRCCGSPDLLI
jgi:hypothetical protein